MCKTYTVVHKMPRYFLIYYEISFVVIKSELAFKLGLGRAGIMRIHRHEGSTEKGRGKEIRGLRGWGKKREN